MCFEIQKQTKKNSIKNTSINKITELPCPLYINYILYNMGVSLTEGHPATDDLWALFHVSEGGYRETPVCYWTPEMLQAHTHTHAHTNKERE